MFDPERDRMFQEGKLFLARIDYFETIHFMKMKDQLNAETCEPILKGRTIWILDEFNKEELINFVDSITCIRCKKNLKCPICGSKMHTKGSINSEISQIKVGIELCNARLESNLDSYYDPLTELQKGEKILIHLEKIKSKINRLEN